MYRLLLFITSLLVSLSVFAQTPNDSIQEVRKAQIEKARAAARAKAEARAAERSKMEAQKQEADAKKRSSKDVDADKTNKIDSPKAATNVNDKADSEKPKRDRKAREEKAKDPSAPVAAKTAPKKEEKPKKPSIKERNMADTAIAKSKYGDGTFGMRGQFGASIVWGTYDSEKIGFEHWGFVLSGGAGYRLNHICYAGITLDLEVVELLSFSPMLDIIVSAPTPVAPFAEITAGPYFSYKDNRNWVFFPRVGLSYRGKKNHIARFGFGARMYDDTFKAESLNLQYGASVNVEF